VLRLWLTFSLLVWAARAQSNATLSGSVFDTANLVIPAANVSLVRAETNIKQKTVTDPKGAFHFFGLAPGNYQLRAGKAGFSEVRRANIRVSASETVVIDLVLPLADLPTVIEVDGVASTLQVNTATVSLLVDKRKIENLPLDGRNFVPLIALSPGVNLPPNSTLPRINGSRPRVSEYLYDGISVLQPEPGQVAFFPIVDAIEEFRVDTNSYSAEYGRSNGGVIQVHQRSGTNSFRGTVFEFFRHERMNARNFFANTNFSANTGERPQFRRNQFGYVLGGPIRRNRTFFFTDWQTTKQSTGVVRLSTVPSTRESQGQFSTVIFDPATTQNSAGRFSRAPFAGNQIPRNRWDSAAQSISQRYPLPNRFDAQGIALSANNFRRLANDQLLGHQFDARIDHHFQDSQRAFVRYSIFDDHSQPATPLPDGSGNLTSGIIADTRTRAYGLAAEHSWSLSSISINQLRFGDTRRRFNRNSLNDVTDARRIIPGIPASAFSTVLPTFDVVGWQQLGPSSSANGQFSTGVIQLVDTFSTVRGKHSLKFGVDVRFQHLDTLLLPNPNGTFQFTNLFTAGLTANGGVVANSGNSYASFLLGQVTRFGVDVQPEVLQPRARIAEAFVQDEWRLTRRLSLNLGVRYTLNFPSVEKNDQGAVFDLQSQELSFFGQNGAPRTARNLEKTNLGPRVGFAWQTSATTVIRGGYGLTWIEQAGITTPFTTPLFPFVQTLTQQTLDNLQPAFVLSQGPTLTAQSAQPDAGLGQGVFAVQRDNGSGYAQQWNLSMQKSFGKHWNAEVGYLGSKLTRIGVPDVNLNQLSVEQLQLGAALLQPVVNPFRGQIPASLQLGAPTIPRAQLLRPYPRFTTVALYRNNVGHSTYHSLQARLQKNYSAGLTLTAAYTFSRLIDDAGAVFDAAILTGPATNFQAADSFARHLEKDVSTGNIPHVFSAGFVYRLPITTKRWKWLSSDWQISGLARVQSGSPLAVIQANNLNAFAGFGIQRPNRRTDPTLSSAERSTARWFHTGAFEAAPQFTIGNSSRNPVAGPGFRTLDLTVMKEFAVFERARLEWRAEIFNATNSPSFGNPNTQFGTPAFGTITTAFDPRVVQLAIKLHF
jgi:hypothetical protein